ncbi:peripheral-type benzodiazepine receptor-associated protein 1 isoform X5 [Hippoglossus hippoglossus]|uniref:peripheral-type benzodiazepine receptor-associated protein 1 isoform X5 n=1 Tax=Hippoglossus hippoglossus TaxID=8267 RepID=UPI00148D3105|nr:peripheral-type benzodiazepine receptor-associated protein 1 isoform X5 [Hippoglossus hippoglossus]
MRKDRDNPLALSSKKYCQSQADYGRELERLRAELETEKSQTQRARGHLSVELRRLREEAEREQKRAVRELTARRGTQKHLHSDRRRGLVAKEVNNKHTGQCSKDESSGKEAFRLSRGETYRKLELLLLTLYEEINGEQAVYKLHQRQDIELEKAIFLCHLLETHGRPLQGIQRAGHPSNIFDSLSRKPTQEDGDKSCQRLQRSQSASHSSKKSSKEDQQKQPSGRDLCESDPSTAAAVVDTCRSGSLKICHPNNTPHAGWDDQPPSCTESSPSKCMERNMERVMYDLFTRPEQPEPVPATEMEVRDTEAPGQQQEFRRSEEQVKTQHGLLDKAVPTTANITSTSLLGKRHHSLYANLNGFEVERVRKNGTDYGFLVRQNSELLRALDELEKTCTTLREENCLLRKSSAPETEEKVRRLRRKNTELAVLAKRLEERARKLQEANLKVVNSPSLMRPGSVEQYKRAFARQRARDLAQHADALLSKDKEIAALQQECRELEARLGTTKDSPVPSGRVEFERLLRESQREVLRLQRQLSITSSTQQHNHSPDPSGLEKCEETEEEEVEEKVGGETPCVALDEAPSRCEKTPGEEEELGLRVTPTPGLCPNPSGQEDHTEEQRLQFLESELSKKRKECENLEHEVKKRQKRCLDLESQLEDERGENEQLKEEADLLRRKAQLLDQTRAENEELREDLSEVTAQHNSVLEENQRLRAKLENLEQVLQHMREVAERRQQLELEHEQALAILKFKQDEIKRLQRAQLFAKREHEGVVQMLESTLDCMQSKVRDLEDKCRSQSEQFGLLSQELEKFRLQASKVDLAGSPLLHNPANLSLLTNGVGLTTERDCTDGSWDMVSLGEIAFWSLEGGDTLSCPEGNDPLDVAAALRMGATPHAAGLSRVERSPVTKHRELPTISVSKSGSSHSKSETTHLTPKSDSHLSPHKSSPTHEVDTASEVEELDIDVAPAPYTASRGAAKLQVFIARYSYNPYDGPNDNPEVELPLTAGEYIYVYGDMDDDGFYEGELMDGRRGLVPSNFVERVSDDDVMSSHHPETGDMTHNSLLDSSLHSASHQHHIHLGASTSERTEAPAPSGPGPASAPTDSASALAVPAPLTNGLDLDLEEVGVDIVPYPRKLTLIKQLAKSIIIGWDPPLVPAGWGNVWSYNVYVDQELRINVPFGSQTKAVLERLDINLKAYRVSVQSLTEKGPSDQLRCSMLVGRDVCVAPTQLRMERITATSANLTWLPSNSNYVHIVSLNEEECELVKAGCYSLCLNNLLPSLHYTVKVEARPHRTPWELPVERREHRNTTITFSTLMAGPPDAPLDVQLEHGPSPGIALISWLPVTIDATGTSNGVRVTGYTIYADKKKVLEVSSPTAGSALLGPSQIQSLQAAQELTVRTMSAHGESCDSLPVNVPSKLVAIMAGPAITAPAVPPPLPCAPVGPSNLPSPQSYMNSAAKVSVLPSTLPSDTHYTGLTVEAAANFPTALHSEDLLSSASYVKAWANPSSAAALAVCETTSPVVPSIIPVTLSPFQVNVTSPTTSAPQLSPVAVPAPAQAPMTAAAAAMLEQRRDTNSPGTIRPFPSITDFIEDPSAKLGIHERIPTPPKAPITHLLNPQDTNVHRPLSTSPLESEVEEEQENTRLVSIEEFLRQDQEPVYSGRQQSYGRGLVEPPSDYNADNSRSDLSDILEEEEEDFYSDHLGESQARGYTVRANRSCNWEPSDSDEDVVERILKLPPQVNTSKQLFSIPELTEEDDSSQEDPLTRRSQPRPRPSHVHQRDSERLRHAPQHHQHQPNPRPNVPPNHHHFNRDPRSLTKEPLLRHGPSQVKPKMQHRVRYADTVDTISYPEEEESLYEGPTSRRVSREKSLLKGLGDRLRREAMLRSQRTGAAAGNLSHGPPPQRPYPVSKTGRTVKSPAGRAAEIDLEYGTDDSEEPAKYGPGEVAMEQMSSEWWVEGAQTEHGRPPLRRELKTDPPVNVSAGQPQWEPGQVPPAVAGPSWGGQAEPSSKPACLQAKQLKGGVDSTKVKGDGDIRIFVALFPYDPTSMSPNPDAAEEELPFTEGQIIKVYGDKDADGFYQGESAGRLGYVPCNMVSEIQVEDEETREQLLQQGFLSTAASMEKIGTRTHAQLPRRPVPPPKPRRSKKVESAALWEESVDSSSQDPSQSAAAAAAVAAAGGSAAPGARRMVAIFDYDPRESSPNTDIEAELTFSAGDVIHVFGDMDEDGFFYGDLNGHRGLVPSNFLQALPEDGPAEPLSAQPATESKKESQVTVTSSTESQHPGCSTAEVSLHAQTGPPRPDPKERTDIPAKPAASVGLPSDRSPAPGPAVTPAAVEVHCSPPAPVPPDSSTKTDCSAQGKKKKGFFSKGRKLFKKLGSSKKE